MSSKRSVHSHSILVEKFSELLYKLQERFNNENIKINVPSTKLYKYLKDLKDLSKNPTGDIQKEADLYYLILKFLQLEFFLEPDNSRFNVKIEDLKKIICGSSDINDSHDKYNGPFYELSLASRYIKGSEGDINVDLSSDCDIIINNNIAIECKYIFSEKRLADNVAKAINQLKKRIENKQASSGYIALDLSHIIDKDEIINFTRTVFKRFIYHHEIMNKQGHMYNELGNINDVIRKNSNFIKTISAYFQNEMEVVFLRSLNTSVIDKMLEDTSIKAIIYQAGFGIGLEHNGDNTSIPVRNLSYYINENLDEDESEIIEKELHKLAVGI